MLEERHLLPESQDGVTGLGGTNGFRAHDKDSTEPLLKRLDALAHRARCDVEGAGGRFEGAVRDDGGEGVDQLGGDSHG